jgi:hypothetical protein
MNRRKKMNRFKASNFSQSSIFEENFLISVQKWKPFINEVKKIYIIY